MLDKTSAKEYNIAQEKGGVSLPVTPTLDLDVKFKNPTDPKVSNSEWSVQHIGGKHNMEEHSIVHNKPNLLGPLWTLAGTSIYNAVTGNGAGILGGLGGANGAAVAHAGVHAADEISSLRSENATLKAEMYSDEKLVRVYQQALEDNKALRSDVFNFVNPLSSTVAEQDKQIAVLRAEITGNKREAELRELLVRSDLSNKISEVANTAACGIASVNAGLTALQTVVAGITKTVVPTEAICPEPMLRYNSWTAPATT